MNRKHILTLAALLLALPLVLASCGGSEDESSTDSSTTDTQSSTESVSETESESESLSETESISESISESETESESETVTETETEAETEAFTRPKTRDEWDDSDPENPYWNLIKVGTSYDGKTDCYDGCYDFGYDVAKVGDGSTFYSVQEAIFYLEELGGGTIVIADDINVCLRLYIPDDGCNYRLAYNFENVDFVFNYGTIYDDNTPNAEGINGYCYYNYLDVLDGISGLGDTYIWNISPYENLVDVGKHLIVNEYVDDEDWYLMYNYVKDGPLNNWPGLPEGEFLP